MQATEQSTPQGNPKAVATGGAPMGSKKIPQTSTPKQTEDEPTRDSPVPGQIAGDDNSEEKAKEGKKDTESKGEPPRLDEGIDLGDEENHGVSEEDRTNVEAPSEAGEEQLQTPAETGHEQTNLDSDHTETGETQQDDLEAQSEAGETQHEDLDKPTEAGETHCESPEAPTEAGEIPHEDLDAPTETGEPQNEGSEAPADAEVIKHEDFKAPTEAAEDKAEGASTELSAPTELGQTEAEEPPSDPPSFAILEGLKINKGGFVTDEKGNPVGRVVQGDPQKMAGRTCDAEGKIWNDSGKVIGKCEPIPEEEREVVSNAPFEDFPDAIVEDASGKITFEGKKIGIVVEGNPKELVGKKVDPDGDILDKHGNVIGKAIREDEAEPEPEEEPVEEKVDCSALAGLKVNKSGNVVGDKGLVGRVVEGALKALVGRTVDAEGLIHNDVGKVIGRAEPIPENEKEEHVETAFEDFPGAIVKKNGDVEFEGQKIGEVVQGDAKQLAGKTVDPQGDIVDKYGTVLGKAVRWEAEEQPEEAPVDKSILAGKRVNKFGNVCDSHGTIFGRLVEGDVKALAGKMCDKEGFVRNEAGDVVGKAELVPEGDREGMKSGPFADFPGCTVQKDGKVSCEQGVVGRLIEGDPKKLFGKEVDEDGEVLDKNGNVIGKAERWEEEEAPKEVDPMSGLKVNKDGEIRDSDGEVIGKLTDGSLDKCAGKKIDDAGDVVDSKGVAIGHVTLLKDIPEPKDVSPMAGLKVNKDGEVRDSDGEVLGKLTDGLVDKCVGKKIDNNGDVIDQNGTPVGHVTLLKDIPEPKDVSPMAGLKVNKNGEVHDLDGNLVGKLTNGLLSKCAGKKIDNDGDVVDQKGTAIGHVSLLEDIPEPEAEPEPEPEAEPEPEQETEEEKETRLQAEEDKKLAIQMANCISQSLERIHPILKEITSIIEKAESLPKDELDEEKVVADVKPLIEEGGRILTEANGVIRGLDPDGRIAGNAKGRAEARDATPEEYRLADLLKELTGSVTQTIDNAKKKISGMPHVKKELNPLWGLLSEPLFQILAAVGLLLSGVLGLVGQLLNGLGLGGLVHGILGGLGITRILDNLGLGKILAPITGSKKK